MTVYLEVINLAVSVDRRALMEAEFAAAGLVPNFFPAVHFRDVEPEELARYCLPHGPWGRTRPGHMATTISHMRAWQRFLETDCLHCAIFEDDVFVATELGRWFADMSWWPDDADMVKLEAWRRQGTSVLLRKPKSSVHGRQVRRLLTRHMGAAGYVITRDAARKLIEAQPYAMVIDHLLFNFNASRVAAGLRTYQIQPALVAQGNEPSGSSRMDANESISRREYWMREARRAWLEIAHPLATYGKFLSGVARFEKVPYRGEPDGDLTDHAVQRP